MAFSRGGLKRTPAGKRAEVHLPVSGLYWTRRVTLSGPGFRLRRVFRAIMLSITAWSSPAGGMLITRL
jgi:hypothetical protein